MYSKMSATRMTVRISVSVITPIFLLRGLEDDVVNDVARVAAAIDDLFEQLVKVLHEDRLERLIFAAVKLLVEIEDQLVGLALDVLQLVVLLLHFLELMAVAKLLHHGLDGRGGLIEHGGVAAEVPALKELCAHDVTLRKFFGGLGDFVERV